MEFGCFEKSVTKHIFTKGDWKNAKILTNNLVTHKNDITIYKRSIKYAVMEIICFRDVTIRYSKTG